MSTAAPAASRLRATPGGRGRASISPRSKSRSTAGPGSTRSGGSGGGSSSSRSLGGGASPRPNSQATSAAPAAAAAGAPSSSRGPHAVETHRCERTRLPIVCASLDCASCSMEACFRATRTWFGPASMHQQRQVLRQLVDRSENERLIRQIGTVLQPMLQKDVYYTLSQRRSATQGSADGAGRRAQSHATTTTTSSTSSLADTASAKLSSTAKAGEPQSAAARNRAIRNVTSQSQLRSTLSAARSAVSANSTLSSSGLASSSSGSAKTAPLPAQEVDNMLLWFDAASFASRITFFQRLFQLCDIAVLRSLLEIVSDKSKQAAEADLIRTLPVHLGKKIFSMLDISALGSASRVCRYWRKLAQEVKREKQHRQDAEDFVLDLKASGDPAFCQMTTYTYRTKDRDVEVQELERNIFCGPYSVIAFKCEREDESRICHYNGNHYVVTGAANKLVRIWDARVGQCIRTISGHAGSLRAVYIGEDLVFSASFDTSLRVWDVNHGQCRFVLRGHKDSVQCLDVDLETGVIVSGSSDSTVRVWNAENGKSIGVFSTDVTVSCIRLCPQNLPATSISAESPYEGLRAVAGTESGMLYYFDITKMKRIAHFNAHRGTCMAVSLDHFHIVSGGQDRFVHVFSTGMRSVEPLISLRHTSPVLTLGFQCLRIVTGAADGKIRVFNLLTGECVRIFRGNSHCDPIVNLSFSGPRALCVNTTSSMHMLNFEEK